jgi:linoleoyl-CoA desaturase
MQVDTIVAAPATKEKITFKARQAPVFAELKKRTKEYFAQSGQEITGNKSLYIKAAFFLTSFILCYCWLLLGTPPVGLAVLGCIYLGFAASALGFNLMHDGAHGSFSKKQWLNTLAAYSINLLGGDAMLWKNKHNIIHHTYTNIEGHDQDIAQMPVLRLNIWQKKYAFHKYQHIYCFPVYGLSSLLWVFLLDYLKYFTGKIGNHKMISFSQKDHVVFWATKIGYILFYLVIPSLFWGWGAALAGFMIFHFVLGITLSVVFQLAHVVESTEFSNPLLEGKPTDEWAVHQLQTTANFATSNKWITWYTGGLNFQVEHHLFPKISHVHYPALNKIVKQVCAEMDVSYNEFSTFGRALRSHIKHLKETATA